MKGQDVPDRLRDRGATDLERRLLTAVTREEPSSELRELMAQAIGVSFGSSGGAGSNPASSAASSKAAAGAKIGIGAKGVLPWVAAGVLGLTVAGGIMGSRLWRNEDSRESPVAVSPTPSLTPPAVAVPEPTPPSRSESAPAPVLSRHDRVVPEAGSLREQIALVDAARTAVSKGAGDRALELLRQYQDQYPSGSFRPEVAALRVDALVKLGRRAEAQSAAKRFVAEFGAGPLADRVLRVAGLARP